MRRPIKNVPERGHGVPRETNPVDLTPPLKVSNPHLIGGFSLP
jgi:hypothetical protein